MLSNLKKIKKSPVIVYSSRIIVWNQRDQINDCICMEVVEGRSSSMTPLRKSSHYAEADKLVNKVHGEKVVRVFRYLKHSCICESMLRKQDEMVLFRVNIVFFCTFRISVHLEHDSREFVYKLISLNHSCQEQFLVLRVFLALVTEQF